MTGRDVTGFYAFLFAWKSGNFLHILGAISLLTYTEALGEQGKKQLEKFQKSVEMAQICRLNHFCPRRGAVSR